MSLVVVTGTPRSGTSRMMQLMRNIYGPEGAIGSDFPSLVKNIPQFLKDTPAGAYMKEAAEERFNNNERYREHVMSMNPEGFLEDGRFVMRGFPLCLDTKDEIDFIHKGKRYFKLIGSALSRTAPDIVDKLIISVRNPKSVARSRNDLRGPHSNIAPKHNAGPWLNDYATAIKFAVTFDIPFLIVDFDDFSEDPMKISKEICDFLGEPHREELAGTHKKHIPKNIDADKDFEDIRTVYDQGYEFIKEKNFEELFKLNEVLERRKTGFTCARTGKRTEYLACERCVTQPTVTLENVEDAELSGIDWRNEPCLFECGVSLEVSKGISESIQEHSWSEYM
jgi:hypothetical protein